MSKPNLILHAGTHKTGTSAIQKFAYKQADDLLSQGIYYPDYQPFSKRMSGGHHSVAHGLADDSRVLSAKDIVQLSQRWHDLCVDNGFSLMLSAEALYRRVLGEGSHTQRRENYLTRVKEVFAAFDINVVLVYRRPDEYIRSWYQERVMRRAKPLPAFPQFCYSGHAAGVNYTKSARLFSRVFGTATVMTYESLNNGDGLVINFFRRLGIEPTVMPEQSTVRKSLSVPQTVVKNFANQFMQNSRHSERMVKWLKGEEGRVLLNRYFAPEQCYSLWQNEPQRLAFLSSREDDVKQLSKRFFNSGCVFDWPGKPVPESAQVIDALPDLLKAEIKQAALETAKLR